MSHRIDLTNPLAAVSNRTWENHFLLECLEKKRSAPSPSPRSPRARSAPGARSSRRDVNKNNSGARACNSRAVAAAQLSWPRIDPSIADNMHDISDDDDDDSDSSGNDEQGTSGETQQRSRQRSEARGTFAASATGVHDGVGGSSGGDMSAVRKERVEGSQGEDGQENGDAPDEGGDVGYFDILSDGEDSVELKRHVIKDKNRSTSSSSRLPWAGDTNDKAGETRGTTVGWMTPCSKSNRQQKASSCRKQAVRKTNITIKKPQAMRTTASLAPKRALARSAQGGRASKAGSLSGAQTPVPSRSPMVVGTSASESSCDTSEEGLWSSSDEDETESDDDSEDYEPDVLPPNCSGLHKNRKTYKSALCRECYNVYIGKLKEAGLNASGTDSDARRPRNMPRQNHRQRSESGGKRNNNGRAKSGKQTNLQKRSKESRSSGTDSNGGSGRGRKKRPKVTGTMSATSKKPAPPLRGPLAKRRQKPTVAPKMARGTVARSSEDPSKKKGGKPSSGSNGGGGREGSSGGGSQGKKKVTTERLEENRQHEPGITSVRSGGKQDSSRQDPAETLITTGSSTTSSSVVPPPLSGLSGPCLADNFRRGFGGDSAESGSEEFESATLARGSFLNTPAPTASRTKNDTAKAQGKALPSPGKSPKVPRKHKSGPKSSVTASDTVPKKKRRTDDDEQPPVVPQHQKDGRNNGGLKPATSPVVSPLNVAERLVVDKPTKGSDACRKEPSEPRAPLVSDQPLERKEGERNACSTSATDCEHAHNRLHAQQRAAQKNEMSLDAPRDPPQEWSDDSLDPLADETNSPNTSGTSETAPSRKENCRPSFLAPQEVVQDQQPPQAEVTGQLRPSKSGTSPEHRAVEMCASVGTPIAASSGCTHLEETDRILPVNFFSQPRDSQPRSEEHVMTDENSCSSEALSMTDEELYNKEAVPMLSGPSDRSRLDRGSASPPKLEEMSSNPQACPWHKFWSRGDSDGETEKQRADETGRIGVDISVLSSFAATTPAPASSHNHVSDHVPLEPKMFDLGDISVPPLRASVLSSAAGVGKDSSTLSTEPEFIGVMPKSFATSSQGPEVMEAAPLVKASTEMSGPGLEIALSGASSASSGPSDNENWDGILGSWEEGTRGDISRQNGSVPGVGGDVRTGFSLSAGEQAPAPAKAPAQAQRAKTGAPLPINHNVASPHQQESEAVDANNRWPIMVPVTCATRSCHEEVKGRQKTDVTANGSAKKGSEETVILALSDTDSPASPDPGEGKRDESVPSAVSDLESGLESLASSCSRENNAAEPLANGPPPIPIARRTPKKSPTTAVHADPRNEDAPQAGRSPAAVPQPKKENNGLNQGDIEPSEMSLSGTPSRSSSPGPNTLDSENNDDGFSAGQGSDQELNRWTG